MLGDEGRRALGRGKFWFEGESLYRNRFRERRLWNGSVERDCANSEIGVLVSLIFLQGINGETARR